MSERRQRTVSWTLSLIWAGFGLTAAGVIYFSSGGRAPLEYLVSLVVAGLGIGWAAGRLLEGAVRRIGSRIIGGLAGHIAFAPPAIQLGQWVASMAAEAAVGQDAGGSLVLNTAVFVAATVAVLSVGSAVGMALEALIRTILRRFLPRRMPDGLRLQRPSWRSIRITVLTAILIGVAVYADSRGKIPMPDATPPALSRWIEQEKSIFRSALAQQHYDVLVLPVQADGPSFDQTARSLMTRYLAHRVAERTGQRLPDPTLLARAFDVRARQADLDQALRFAESLKAHTVLVSQVRRSGDTFKIQSKVWSRSGAKAEWHEGSAAEIDGLRFHDRLPPSTGFRDAIDILLDKLKLGTAPAAAEQTPQQHAPMLPTGNLLQLVQRSDAPAAERALALQLLASLNERGSIEAKTLWERSLVALWRAPQSASLDRVLEARAYLHLERRPYAVELLGQPDSPAGQALLAVLNGDVPGAESAVNAIDNPALRLIAEIELADLYAAYELTARYASLKKSLIQRAWTDVAVLKYRLSAHEWFLYEVHGQVSAALGRSDPGQPDFRETVAAWMHWLYWLPDPLSEHSLRLARSIERLYPHTWQTQAGNWAARPAADRLAEWDYHDLLFAMNRDAAMRTVRLTLWTQGLPERATTLIHGLEPVLAGHPYLTYLHAGALDDMGYKSTGGARARLYSKSTAMAVSAYRWEGGESDISNWVEQYIYERDYQKYDDEPPRWYRRTNLQRVRNEFERLSYTKKEMERAIADARRKLAYTDRNYGPLTDLVNWLKRAGRVDEAKVVLQENRHRFIGTLARAELLAEAGGGSRDGKETIALYEEVLRLNPGSWDARYRMGKAHMETGQPVEAQKLLLDYPGFSDSKGHDTVGLTNHAFEAGYYFYRRGETNLAEPFFIRSNNFRTGAASEMHSRELLAIMKNDMNRAMSEARHQVDRYNDGRAATRYLSYLFLLGRGEQAWPEFTALVNRFDNDGWPAAYLAHRMQGVEGKAMETWLAQAVSRDTRRSYLSGALRERHAFMLALIDRPASDEALETIRRVVRANNQSPYYPQLAEGYIAFRKGDYAAAAKHLRGPHNDLFNISMNRRESYNELLPYLALAYRRSEQRPEAEKILEDHRNNLGEGADYLIARALIHGVSGEHDAAISLLRLAFHRLPGLNTRAFFPGYTLLEACEILLKESGKDDYRAMIEDFSRRMQIHFPYAWAAAFEAKYARDLDTRQLAIAAATILDPKSERIQHVPESEHTALRAAALRHASALGAALRHAAR